MSPARALLLLLLVASLTQADAAFVPDEAWLRQGACTAVQVTPGGVLELRRRNLLTNPSFEYDLPPGGTGAHDGVAGGWGLWGPGEVYGRSKPASVTRLVGPAVAGQRAQEIQLHAVGTTQLFFNQDVRAGLEPGKAFTFSIYAKVSNPSALEVAARMMAGHDQQWIGSVGSPAARPADYTRLTVTLVVPPGTDHLRCELVARPLKPDPTTTLWLDAAQFERGEQATAFTAGLDAPQGEWVSPPLDLSERGAPYRLSRIAAQPSSTSVELQLRAADSAEGLATAAWAGPEGREAFASPDLRGPNLVGNPSLEQTAGGQPTGAEPQGWGDNERASTLSTEAHTGRVALQERITRYANGDGRWQVFADGPFAAGALYGFTVWHREDSELAPVSLAAALKLPDGTMRWGYANASVPASTAWKQDRLLVRLPRELVARIQLSVNLAGVGTLLSDDYELRRAEETESWPLAPAQRGHRWVQLRARLSTTDTATTPRLYEVRLETGTPQPEFVWFNLLGVDGKQQKYAFAPGATVVFRPELLTTGAPLSGAKVTVRDPAGRERGAVDLQPQQGSTGDDAVATGRWQVPADAASGEWQASCHASTAGGGASTATAVFKVGPPFRGPAQRMILSAIVSDFGFHRYQGEGLRQVIDTYRSAKGLDEWLVALNWATLEPQPGRLNEAMLTGLRTLIGAAPAGVKVKVTIQQQAFPDWANNGQEDSTRRFTAPVTAHLANTWRGLAMALADPPALAGYQLINEENAIPGADEYLRGNAKVAAAIREADPNPAHLIYVRPNTEDPYLRTRVGEDGPFDFDNGTGVYPTHWSWFYPRYANPVSQTAAMRMVRLRTPPLAFGMPGGIGEIGFYARRGADTFGDAGKLAGFERAMRIAYQMGMEGFCLWAGEFSFADLPTYVPKLAAFRDELIKQPRPTRFDVRVVLDGGERLYVDTRDASALDMKQQPLATLARFLDEQGWVWYYTTPEALPLQHLDAAATIRFSELKGKPADEQRAVLTAKLAGLKPSGEPLPWPDNVD